MKSKFQNKLIAMLLVVMMLASFTVTAYATDATDSSDDLTFVVGSLTATDWETAKLYAVMQGETTITLGADSVLTSSLVIDSGYTLVIPTSADASDTLTGNNASGAVSNLAEGIKLTMTGDASITVNGTLLVAGNQQSTTGDAGCLTGSYGVIDMTSSSNTITVNDGGALYARGEISGDGTVTANSGAAVYQLFQIHDWRGGTASYLAYNASVFPFNLYEFNNITAATTYNYGSTLIGQTYIYANGAGNTGEVTIIGDKGQFEFETATLASGNIQFEQINGIIEVTINGVVQTNDIAVTMSMGGTVYEMSSAGLICPFGYKMNVTVSTGSTLDIKNNFKFLPDCTVTVESKAAMNVTGGYGIYFYTADVYSTSNNVAAWNGTADAALVNNGGTVYAASDGYGTIACASNAFTNVDGFEAGETTVTIGEYRGGYAATAVTFYVGAASTSDTETND